MTEQNAEHGWFARWREHRRAKRQQVIEREGFEQERGRSRGAYSTTSACQQGAPAGGWIGFGGDGGGCGGGDGGGGGGC